MEWLTTQAVIALLMLTMLEIVLGIDNVVFISILTGKLPEHQRRKATIIGLGAAMLMRIVLLIGIKWIMGLTKPIFDMLDRGISWKDIILIGGGGFLVFKAVREIHHNVEGIHKDGTTKAATFASVIFQIVMLDLIFSLDSVITAVGMADQLWVMITAVVVAIGVMMIFANPISGFVQRHPAMKILALAFLVLIGVALVIEGFAPDPLIGPDGEEHGGHHGFKGYIYAAMGFGLIVELLQLRMSKNRRRRERLKLEIEERQLEATGHSDAELQESKAKPSPDAS